MVKKSILKFSDTIKCGMTLAKIRCRNRIDKIKKEKVNLNLNLNTINNEKSKKIYVLVKHQMEKNYPHTYPHTNFHIILLAEQ